MLVTIFFDSSKLTPLHPKLVPKTFGTQTVEARPLHFTKNCYRKSLMPLILIPAYARMKNEYGINTIYVIVARAFKKFMEGQGLSLR